MSEPVSLADLIAEASQRERAAQPRNAKEKLHAIPNVY